MEQIVLSIGDLHGSPLWEKIVEVAVWDKLVFQGDYVDHWTRSNVEILHNLKKIIALKESNPNNVTLLIGNHDWQYMYGNLLDMSYTCSGFRPEAYWDLYDIFKTYNDYFSIAFELGNYLFTHSGVTTKWWKKYEEDIVEVYNRYNEPNEYEHVSVAQYLNFLRHTKEGLDIFWEVGYGVGRGGIRGNVGSPIWADQQETRFGALKGWNHVVGHTPVKELKTYTIDDKTSVTYTDCLEKGDFFIKQITI